MGSFSSVAVLRFIFWRRCIGSRFSSVTVSQFISSVPAVRFNFLLSRYFERGCNPRLGKLTKEPPFENNHSKREFRTLKQGCNHPISGKYVTLDGGFVFPYRCFALGVGFGRSAFTAVSSFHIAGSRFGFWRNRRIPKRGSNRRFKN